MNDLDATSLRERALGALGEREAAEERAYVAARHLRRTERGDELRAALREQLGFGGAIGFADLLWQGPAEDDPVVIVDGVRFRIEGRHLVAQVIRPGCGHDFQQTIRPEDAMADVGLVVRKAEGDCRFCEVEAAKADAEAGAESRPLSPVDDLVRALQRLHVAAHRAAGEGR